MFVSDLIDVDCVYGKKEWCGICSMLAMLNSFWDFL